MECIKQATELRRIHVHVSQFNYPLREHLILLYNA